jgi:adhesin/invasin
VENSAIAAKALVGGSTTTVTLMTLTGTPGYVGFMTPVNYSSLVAECSYGDYDPETGLVTWNGTGVLSFLYINGVLQLSAADGFPADWSFSDPAGQPDGSWTLTVTEEAIAYTLSGLKSDKSAIINNGTSTATLTATVLDADGNPAPAGVEVSWSTSTGLLGSATSVTNDSGLAINTLTDSGDTGTATVTATLGTDSLTTDVKLVAEGDLVIKQLTSDKESLKNNGTDTARLYALVEDGQGNPVPDVTVNWAVDKSGGELSAETSVTVNTGGAGNTVTDQGDSGVLTVTATLPVNGNTLTLEIPLEMATDTLIFSSLVAEPMTILSDGSQLVALTATVTYPDGSPAPSGVTIYWSDEPQEGVFELGNPTQTFSSNGSTIATNAWKPNGELALGSIQFTALLETSEGSGTSKQVNVAVVSPDATYIISSLSSDKATITNDGTQTATITAVVQDQDGNPAPAGVDVTWATDLGTLGSTTSQTDASGTAVTTLTDSNSGDTGTATISATVDNNTWKTTVEIGAHVIASVSSDKSSIYNDGTQTATLTAVVHEADGSTAPAGVTVNWSTTLGTLGSATSQTDASGRASTTLKDSAGDTGTATVTATLDSGSSGNVTVNVTQKDESKDWYLASYEYEKAFIYNDAPRSGSSSAINSTALSVVIVDENNNPVSGAGVKFTVQTNGVYSSGGTVYSGSDGVAVEHIYAEISASAADKISVSALVIESNRTYDVGGCSVKELRKSLTFDKDTLVADGQDRATATLKLTDETGAAVGGISDLPWNSNYLTFVSKDNATNASGVATAVVTSTTVPPSSITATVGVPFKYDDLYVSISVVSASK